jgi:hypothetical protein
LSTLGFLLEKKYWNLYDGGSSRGIVNEGKHEKIVDDLNKVEASPSNKKT